MVNIFWFRRDLRLEDNAGLYHALSSGIPILPVFIFDEDILGKLEDTDDPRVTFIYGEVTGLKEKLERTGSSLLIKYGKPEQIFAEIISTFHPLAVFTNHDYEPYARQRDEGVARLLHSRQVDFFSFMDQVIFEKNEVVKDSGEPYTVFTPYSKKWKSIFSEKEILPFPSEKFTERFLKIKPLDLPPLSSLGFKMVKIDAPSRQTDSDILRNYHLTRDYPAVKGTSRLSVHLRFGTISIRQLVKTAVMLNELYLNELIWREFYMMILWHFPAVVGQSFKPQYDLIGWRNDEKEFNAWCEGRTGYPIVDAGMRELNQTGYMHNRLRMITASFLTKHLLTDWRWGEAYFARKLMDYELASNNGGWQWAAGTGCDAAPYFRVFSPEIQTRKFDPELIYVCKFVPELNTGNYPKPLVDHAFARNRAIAAYKMGLTK